MGITNAGRCLSDFMENIESHKVTYVHYIPVGTVPRKMSGGVSRSRLKNTEKKFNYQ